MFEDKQLSTVLLLIVLGFLIYQLTKPKTTSENFANNEPVLSESVHKALPMQVHDQHNMSEVHPDILRQILAESEALPVHNKSEQESSSVNQVFNFEANDINNELGADLMSAFDRPISQKASPDQVPMNNNNLKKYDAKDFLPKEINDQWFDTDFSQAKYNVNDDKLINTERYVIGINTVGQSLKNASYDMRGTIPNPKFTVSPWHNSTIEPDYNLKSLC